MTTMTDEEFALLRTHRNNIHRYRGLLKTKLTELERQFIERRLAEEKIALDALVASSFPMKLGLPSAKLQDSAPEAFAVS
jgi:hypothetical protein